MFITLPPRVRNLSGQRFGRLLAIGPIARRKNGHTVYLCGCDCGHERRVTCSNLKSGHSTSCGCYQLEMVSAANSTHGRSKTKLYSVWMQMRQRCYLKSAHNYKWYGGRGIKVCERWASFENFVSDMGSCPPGYSIDRIDVDGDYEPSNCRWVSSYAQAQNTRQVRLVSFNGQTQSISEWERDLGWSPDTLGKRLRRGMSVSDAMRTPRRIRRAS